MAAPTKKDPAPPARKAPAAPAPAPKAAASAQPKPAPSTPASKGESQMSKRAASADEIARRAYELWLERGGNHGDDQADWHRAESELAGRRDN